MYKAPGRIIRGYFTVDDASATFSVVAESRMETGIDAGFSIGYHTGRDARALEWEPEGMRGAVL